MPCIKRLNKFAVHSSGLYEGLTCIAVTEPDASYDM